MDDKFTISLKEHILYNLLRSSTLYKDELFTLNVKTHLIQMGSSSPNFSYISDIMVYPCDRGLIFSPIRIKHSVISSRFRKKKIYLKPTSINRLKDEISAFACKEVNRPATDTF